MFMLDDATIRAVHAAYARGGDLAAVVEVRERFPGLASAAALDCVRRILAMQPGKEAVIAARLAAVRAEQRAKRGYVIRW